MGIWLGIALGMQSLTLYYISNLLFFYYYLHYSWFLYSDCTRKITGVSGVKIAAEFGWYKIQLLEPLETSYSLSNSIRKLLAGPDIKNV